MIPCMSGQGCHAISRSQNLVEVGSLSSLKYIRRSEERPGERLCIVQRAKRDRLEMGRRTMEEILQHAASCRGTRHVVPYVDDELNKARLLSRISENWTENVEKARVCYTGSRASLDPRISKINSVLLQTDQINRTTKATVSSSMRCTVNYLKSSAYTISPPYYFLRPRSNVCYRLLKIHCSNKYELWPSTHRRVRDRRWLSD